MHLTRHTDYALRLLLHVASHDGGKSSIAEVAEIHGISHNHLMKVVQQLAHAGFLETRRGRGGGFSLGRKAEDIRLGDVVRLTEPDAALAECGTCRIRSACSLMGILWEARAALMAVLDRYTLADAAGNGQALSALVESLRAAGTRQDDAETDAASCRAREPEA